MTTIINLIERVLLNLEGYTGDADIYGTLSANITNSATSFTVLGSTFADGSGFSTGLIEIGTELAYVQNINRTTGEFSGVLRGFRGTTPTAWAAGTRVRNNPRFPIQSVLNAINDTIKSLYPRIIAPAKIEFTGIASRVQYDLPNDAVQVLSVNWLPSGSAKAWVPVKKWNFDNFAGSNAGTNKIVNLAAPATGRPIQVVYAKEPSAVTIDGTFANSGLPSWLEEVVIFGACWRLASFIDSSKVSQTTAEQSLLNSNGDVRSNTSGTSLAKYFLGMYEQQILLAQQRQSKELPQTKHRLI
jgi:hypothetical protein